MMDAARAAAALASLIASLLIVLGGRRGAAIGDGLSVKTPDDIWFAVSFGGMLAAIGLAAYFARLYFGDAGLYALAAISGPFDVDAFSLSVARSIGAGATSDAAATAVLLCVAIVHALDHSSQVCVRMLHFLPRELHARQRNHPFRQ